MTSIANAENEGLNASRGRGAVTGSGWPVSAVALAALVDMGMSDDRIGRYFRVDVAEVRRQRERAAASGAGRAGVGRGDEGGVAPGKVAG